MTNNQKTLTVAAGTIIGFIATGLYRKNEVITSIFNPVAKAFGLAKPATKTTAQPVSSITEPIPVSFLDLPVSVTLHQKNTQ